MRLGSKEIRMGEFPALVAELSANHNNSLEHVLKTVEAAKNAGADAIKIQTYTPDTLTIPSKGKDFQIGGGTLWDGKSLHELYGEAATPWEWTPHIKEAAEDLGLGFFSTAYDPTAVDFLEKLNVPVHKIASFEIVDIPLISKMASTGRPLILSTGMATIEEIEEAVKAAHEGGAGEILLLKCTSAYPAPSCEMNLRSLGDLHKRFGVAVGLSDHSLGSTAAVVATTLGACFIEKHFTLSRQIKTPDSEFSMEPAEFLQMAKAVREAFESLGSVRYGITESQESSRTFRRSLYVVKPIKAGEALTSENIRSIRPGFGLSPRHLSDVLKTRALRDIPEGSPLSWEDIEEA
jgi:pseudaminic acid synthase